MSIVDDLVASISPQSLVGLFLEIDCICHGGTTAGLWCLSCGRGGSQDFLQGGIPPSQHHPGHSPGMMCPLARGNLLVGRGVTRTTGSSLLGVEFPDTCLDMSNTVWDRRSLTSMVMLTSLSAFGRGALMGFAIRMEEE